MFFFFLDLSMLCILLRILNFFLKTITTLSNTSPPEDDRDYDLSEKGSA